MPNYLRLIDKRMRADFGVPVDSGFFYMGWPDWDSLYVCDDWPKVRAIVAPSWEKKGPIVEWLEKHFVLSTYYMGR